MKQRKFPALFTHANRGLQHWPATAASLACLALAIRFLIKDRCPFLSAAYYVTPPHVIAFLFLVAALGWCRRHRFRLASGAFFSCAVLVTAWFHGSWYFAPSAEKAGSAHVVLWNIGRGAMGYSRIVQKIKDQAPDLIALNEAGRNPERTERLFRDNFPGYSISRMKGGMLVLVKGECDEAGEMISGDGIRFRQYHVKTRNVSLNLVTVDMISNLLASRERAFARVYQAFPPLLAAPLLIMGDFNTPTDSIYLAPWREKLLNGFESAGRGCSATWPTFLPVQAIDQVWFNRKLDVSHFLLHNTLLSDHRMVTLEIATANDMNTLKDYHDRASD